MNPADCQTQLHKKYLRENWHALLPQLLPGVELFEQPQDFPLTNDRERTIATARRQFGRARLADGKTVAFYEIDVAAKVDLLRNRVALRELVARCIDEVSAHAVFAFFVQSGNNAYRLTYAAKESRLGDDLKIHTEQTATRRFTYVLGPGERRRTAALRLAALSEKNTAAELHDVTDAFSVEKVNREFFDTYKLHYQKFCEHLVAGDAPAKVFDVSLRGLDEKARDRALKPVRDFVKKLLGRLVFLHFLQKKGWLGCPANVTNWKNGDPDFIRQLFDTAPEAEQKRFHSRRLVPLYFDTLNRERADNLFEITGTRVPYLNGGLFERDFDGVEKIDFPPELFANLLEFFGQYNFTIDENDPDDHEIGIDPEMLGQIFENLLEDNKNKGAFYTPKAVVQYMCQQSLIHALCSHFPGDAVAKREIEKLIRTKEPVDARQDSWLARHATQLSKILDELRICDPAIGSGAFPIGMLSEIFWTKLALNPSLDRAKAKRDIIQRSIYGVDIDAGAVEIARLRFWLALIVEEKNPVPLPNLDYQIMQGNSLLESFEGIDLSKLDSGNSGGHELTAILGDPQGQLLADEARAQMEMQNATRRDEISKLLHDYFNETKPETKTALRQSIDGLAMAHLAFNIGYKRDEIEVKLRQQRGLLAGKRVRKKGWSKDACERAIASLENELAVLVEKGKRLRELEYKPERPFFLWHLWFRHVLKAPPDGCGGFDIVIANPPYVRQEVIKDQKAALQAEPYECFSGTADLYVYFYELAAKLLRHGGVLVFISSNSFLNAAFGEKLRGFLAGKHKIHELIDFGEADVFAAVTEPLIITATKEKPADGASVRVMKWREENKVEYIAQRFAVAEVNVSQKTLVDDIWKIESAPILRLLEKLSENGTPFRTLISSKIFWGLKTALNEAYVVDESTRTRLIAEHPSSSKILRPFLRGKDVSRWNVNLSGLYLIRIESSANKKHPWSGKPQAEAKKIFEQTYPAIARWLAPFKDKLVARDDQGNYYWELRSCDYWDEFAAPKIIYQDIARYFGMAWDDSGSLLVNTCYFIPNAEKWMLGILLSSTMRFYVEKSLGSDEGGFIRLFTIHVEKFPFPKTNAAEQAALSGLVDGILAAKRTGNAATVTALESEIDTHVFHLYALTPAEIALVKGTAK
jgi:hypothetical protein